MKLAEKIISMYTQDEVLISDLIKQGDAKALKITRKIIATGRKKGQSDDEIALELKGKLPPALIQKLLKEE